MKPRLFAFLGWAAFALVSGFAFCVFGWTAGNVPPPVTGEHWPFPSWLWTGCMVAVAISSLVAMCGATTAALDSLLPVNDPRRIVGRR